MPLLPLLLLGSAAARRSPPGLFRPPRAEGGVPITRWSREKYNKFKAIAKTLPVPFVLYADFEAFLVPAEENKERASNTNVRQLHKPSGFACLRVSQVQEFNREIFRYSIEVSMTIFFQHIRDQDHYDRSILSGVKPMKTLTAEQQLQHDAATTCELCHGSFTMKNKKTEHHCHLSRYYIGPYCNTCNLKLKYKKGPNSDTTAEKKNKKVKIKQTKFFNGIFRKFIKKGWRRCQRQRRSGHRWLHDDGGFIHDPCHFS